MFARTKLAILNKMVSGLFNFPRMKDVLLVNKEKKVFLGGVELSRQEVLQYVAEAHNLDNSELLARLHDALEYQAMVRSTNATCQEDILAPKLTVWNMAIIMTAIKQFKELGK